MQNIDESIEIDKENFEREEYYRKYHNENYCTKHKHICNNYLTFDYTNKEEFYYHNGISDSNFELKSKFFNNKARRIFA